MKAKNLYLDSNKQEISSTIPGFPVSCYYNQFTANTYDSIDWHWHMKFQLCLTTHGTVVWNTEAHKTLIPTGEGIFINSEQVHMAKPLGKEAAFFCIDISPDFLCPEKENPDRLFLIICVSIDYANCREFLYKQCSFFQSIRKPTSSVIPKTFSGNANS